MRPPSNCSETEWAHHEIKELVDECYPQAERIVLVMDNLNHPLSSFAV